ncbi:MAG: 50S ribosomal protein L6 [Candidatus Pacebacteria bacterium]|nr:50S ribosomal protein L6 [Candidatus Paceibacterota bacterium]
MSRLGKRPIAIPKNTEVTVVDGLVNVKGPKGELNLAFRPAVKISLVEEGVLIEPSKDNVESNSLWGTYASEIKSMIKGVNEHFEKKLIVEGVGFKCEMADGKLKLALGFSHPVIIEIPDGISCVTEKNTITISGPSKERVGQFTAVVRSNKKPEPYKGKGIRYSDEVVRRKEGKKAS